MIRLSFSQLGNAIAELSGSASIAAVLAEYEFPDARSRTFPALASPREGTAYAYFNVPTVDRLAADVAEYAVENSAAFSGCGAELTQPCVNDFIADFAERAYRRPLSRDEEESVLAVVASVLALGDSPAEALRYGVHAVLSAPQFLYRTELGGDSAVAGPLAPYELADALAFFLTDAPPDAALLQAAREDGLATAPQITTQAKRLLASPRARQNLEGAMFGYWGLSALESVKIDRPDFTTELRTSMRREAERFLSNTLWSGPLTLLLTSRESSIDAQLAAVYGISAFPPPNGAPDSQGFVLVELPDDRAGLLTQPGALVARARPDATSPVLRGLWVNAAAICATNPPLPESIPETLQDPPDLSNATERERARYRLETAPCNGCHSAFDAYGLALETFDVLGRYRSIDDQGRPIDPSVTLPAFVGGGQVGSAAEMAGVIAQSGRFESCMARNFLTWALAESPPNEPAATSLAIDGCAPRAIVDAFRQTDGTFEELLVQIAASPTFWQRAAGQEAR